MESAAMVEVEDVRQSEEYARYMEKIGWKVEGCIFVRKLGPVSIAKIQRTNLPKDWESILRRNRVIMCKYEPLDGKPSGFKQDNWPLLATRTLRIDLRPNERQIFESFKKDCRYCIRKLQSDKVTKVQRGDFGKFYEIWKRSAWRKNLWIPGEKEYKSLIKSFGEKCFCLTLLRQGFEGQAGAVILMHKKTAFYYYAGSSVKSDLPYLVVWKAMKEAKKRGCKIWDFEGIYDSRWPNKGWRGFSHFKRSFGGEEVKFPGCFTKWSLKNVIYPFKREYN